MTINGLNSSQGASLNVAELKTNIKSINLNDIELFKLEGIIDSANFMGDDDSIIEDGAEKNKLIYMIKSSFRDKADGILERLGLSGSAKADNINHSEAVEKKPNNLSAEPIKSSSQKFIEETLKDPEFASDKTFQKYTKFINALDKQMQTIENEYGFTRDDFSGPLKIVHKNKNDYDKYTELSLKFKMYSPMLQSYVKEMKNWKDGSLGERSFENRNGVSFTNLERITLKDGSKAWKSNEGVFYPYIDGRIGGQPVEDKSLIP